MELKEIQKTLLEIEKEYSKIYEELMLAEWTSQNSGEKKDFDKVQSAKLKFNKFLSNKSIFKKLERYKELDIKNKVVERQIVLLYNDFLSRQGSLNLLNKISRVETESGMVFNKYRAKINGKIYTDNELKKILKNSVKEQELRKAWESNKKQGALVEILFNKFNEP